MKKYLPFFSSCYVFSAQNSDVGGKQSRARALKNHRILLSTQEPLRRLSKIATPDGAIV